MSYNSGARSISNLITQQEQALGVCREVKRTIVAVSLSSQALEQLEVSSHRTLATAAQRHNNCSATAISESDGHSAV